MLNKKIKTAIGKSYLNIIFDNSQNLIHSNNFDIKMIDGNNGVALIKIFGEIVENPIKFDGNSFSISDIFFKANVNFMKISDCYDVPSVDELKF